MATSSTSTPPNPTWPEYNCADRAATVSIPGARPPAGHLQADVGPFAIHPSYDGYPEETGNWSDHAPFACLRVPIAYVEATNFTINGEAGYDGYSQSTNPARNRIYDDATKSACDPGHSETQWGKIWHTEHDRPDRMAELFPGRMEQQLGANTDLDDPFPERTRALIPRALRRALRPGQC